MPSCAQLPQNTLIHSILANHVWHVPAKSTYIMRSLCCIAFRYVVFGRVAYNILLLKIAKGTRGRRAVPTHCKHTLLDRTQQPITFSHRRALTSFSERKTRCRDQQRRQDQIYTPSAPHHLHRDRRLISVYYHMVLLRKSTFHYYYRNYIVNKRR